MTPRDQGRALRARKGRLAATLAAAGALGACAHFTAAPLPGGPDLAPSASQISVDVTRIRLAPLPKRAIDPARGIDPVDAAILAVLNSPDLAAKRAAAHVSAAQTFSAGLLPDPTVPLSTDIPDVATGFYTAFAVTPTIDISALITRSATLAAARA
ncbi:MAG TPA: hypothetical protein VFE10_04890, partial [Phenylobacterium sp.]|nr:hypothetical protein [Phenylobacterium sp.]